MNTPTSLLGALSLCAVLIPISSPTARADVSIGGGTGLPLNPTADITQSTRVEATYYDLGDLDLLGQRVSTLKLYGARAATRIGSRLELSGGVDKLDASDPFALGLDALQDTNAVAAVKFQLLEPDAASSGVRLAAGAGYNRALFRNFNSYLVASSSLGNDRLSGGPVTGHLGVRYDKFSLKEIGGPDDSKVSVYGGVEVPLSPRGDLSLLAEVQSKNNDLGRENTPYSLSVRLTRNSLNATAGVAHQGVSGKRGFFAQFGLSFN